MRFPEERMCKCGHVLGEHHIVYYSGGCEGYDECEYWGFNETGGMRWDPTLRQWFPHCDRFEAVPLVAYRDGTIDMEGAYGVYRFI